MSWLLVLFSSALSSFGMVVSYRSFFFSSEISSESSPTFLVIFSGEVLLFVICSMRVSESGIIVLLNCDAGVSRTFAANSISLIYSSNCSSALPLRIVSNNAISPVRLDALDASLCRSIIPSVIRDIKKLSNSIFLILTLSCVGNFLSSIIFLNTFSINLKKCFSLFVNLKPIRTIFLNIRYNIFSLNAGLGRP